MQAHSPPCSGVGAALGFIGLIDVVGLIAFGLSSASCASNEQASPGFVPEDPRDGRTDEGTPTQKPYEVEFGLRACPPADEASTCHTNRVIAGVSMGAHGAGYLGFSRPELFDTVGLLGAPMVDWIYMLRAMERSYLGGFCELAQIEARVDQLQDPQSGAFCGAAKAEVKILADGRLLEPEQHFNEWYVGSLAGRGGPFGRNRIRESFQDIALAFGNPASYNPESPYLPVGFPLHYRSIPDVERCANPIVLRGFKHARFNPDGKYPVISICDTDTDAPRFDPERPAERPVEILLAVDVNGNGVRDYAEPVLFMPHEPYQDTGVRPDDVYDWDTRPTGTAHDARYQKGEPYEDVGLDGVAGTGDFGEGNGAFDYNPNVLHLLDTNPRALLERMPDGQLARLNIYADAGIRDFLGSAAATNWFWGTLTARVGAAQARTFVGFRAVMEGGSDGFDAALIDFQRELKGQHVYVRYGDPTATDRVIEQGDGQHVGTLDQVLNRLLSVAAFAQSRMIKRDVRRMYVRDSEELIRAATFYSRVLHEERKLGVLLPPGYFEPRNANGRYPVMYFLHGQGMDPDMLLPSWLLYFRHMADSKRPDRLDKDQSDWAKFIVVFPDGSCFGDSCLVGSFNANHRGIDGKGPRYFDALLELMAHIETTYRVAEPVVVPKP